MSEATVDRVVAEAALAKKFKSEIDERASKADIPALVRAVEAQNAISDGPEIAFDTDGVPYLTTGE